MLDYDIVSGVPARMLENESEFEPLAFSGDGELFAAVSERGELKVWRRTDYALVGKMQMSRQGCRDVSFVDGRSDILRVIENESYVYFLVDLKLEPSYDGSHAPSDDEEDTFEEVRRSEIDELLIYNANFSEDGNTFTITTGDERIHVYKLQDAIHSQEEDGAIERITLGFIQFRQPKYSSASLSLNGFHVWASYTLENVPPDEREPHSIAVWPRLLMDVDTPSPLILPGERAVWASSGEYLAVWEKDGPILSVYKMDDLMHDHILLIAQKRLQGPDIYQAMGRKRPSRSLLIREICKSGKERYLEWDFEKDVVLNEILIDRKGMGSDFGWDYSFPSLKDICPPWDEDGIDWIGSLDTNQNFQIVSRSSGATVFNVHLPDDMDFTCGRSRIRFDPRGRHFLVIGLNNIFAFAPQLYQCSTPRRISQYHFSGNVLGDVGDDITWDSFYQLKGCPLNAFRHNFGELKAFWPGLFADQVFYKTVVSSSCLWFASTTTWFTGPLEADPRRDDYATKFTTFIARFEDSDGNPPSKTEGYEIVRYADNPQALFLSPVDDATDRLILVDKDNPLQVSVFDVDSQGRNWEAVEVSLNIEEWLHITQTQDLNSLVILARSGAVWIVDLKTMSVAERIQYQIDFKEAPGNFYGFRAHDNERIRWTTRRMISDDGRKVLFGWNWKTSRSILVTPEMTQHEIEKAIAEAGQGLSPHCQLTKDGEHTLFTDLHEGRVVIGIYSNKDLRVVHASCIGMNPDKSDGRMDFFTKIHLFYELSDDASELLVFPDERAFHGFSYEEWSRYEPRKFDIYNTEKCIPDYGHIVHTANGTTPEKMKRLPFSSISLADDHVVDRLCTEFGFVNAFNHPASDGTTIFQEAFLKGDQAMVKKIEELAQLEGLQLAARNIDKDLLAESIGGRIVQRVEQAIDLKTSDQCPVPERASMTVQDVSDAMQLASARVTKAFIEDQFVVELSRIDVHTDFLDPVIRRDSGVHVDTVDEVFDWKLDGHPEILAQRWTEEHAEVVDNMEKNGNKSRATAALKVACIDGAARPGPLGLIRHLLLRQVSEDVFKSKAVKWIVTWKWFKIWKPKFIRMGLRHCAFLACLTAYTILLAGSNTLEHSDAETLTVVSTSVLIFLLFCYGILMAIEEKRELMSLVDEGRNIHHGKRKGVRYYFGSKWNWVDTASVLVLIILMPLFHLLALFGHCNSVLSAVVAIEVLFSYIKAWYYVQPFRVTGALVLMIENIIKDCLPFLGLAFIVLMGFVLAIQVMLRNVVHGPKNDGHDVTRDIADDRNNEDIRQAYGTFPKSALTLFYALFGDFDSEVYSAEHDLKLLVLITFALFMIAQVILLLNLLISIMGDTFERVKSNEEGQMLLARAMIIDSCEASATKKEKEEIERMTGRYVCALDSVDEQSDDAGRGWWSGKFNMMVEKFRSIIAKTKNNLEDTVKEEVQSLKAQTETINSEVQSLQDKTEESAQRLEQRIAAVEERLHQLSTTQASAISELSSSIADSRTQIQNLSSNVQRILSLLESQAES